MSKFEQSLVEYFYRHGENIVNIIGHKIDKTKYCIYHVAWYHPGESSLSKPMANTHYYEALLIVSKLKNVAGINMSLGSPNHPGNFMKEEYDFMKKWTNTGVKVVVAAGNDHQELTEKKCFVYPACLQKDMDRKDNFYVIGGRKIPMLIQKPISNWSEFESGS
jgi:hypothetical protein